MKPYFNQKSEANRDDALKMDFTLTLTGPAAGAEARAETLAAALQHWPQLRGTGDSLVSDVRVQVSDTGAGQVVLKATEPAILDIQRQFATDILRVDPQPDVILPSRRPQPVDPFDIRFW